GAARGAVRGAARRGAGAPRLAGGHDRHDRARPRELAGEVVAGEVTGEDAGGMRRTPAAGPVARGGGAGGAVGRTRGAAAARLRSPSRGEPGCSREVAGEK